MVTVPRDTDSLTFSRRILSPHAMSNLLLIKIRSSGVTFHCWLAKWTTAKSRPNWPAAISSFTFPTTSVEEKARLVAGWLATHTGHDSHAALCSPGPQ